MRPLYDPTMLILVAAIVSAGAASLTAFIA
jgi:hypothetical protein